MSSKFQILFFATLLSFIGLSIALYKGLVLGIPFTPDNRSSVYKIGAKISFEAKGEPVKVSFAIPKKQQGIRIISKETSSEEYGYNINHTKEGERAEWAKREPKGMQSIFYNIDVVMDKEEMKKVSNKPIKSHKGENLYGWDNQTVERVKSFLHEVYTHSSDSYSFAAQLLKELKSRKDSQLITVLKNKNRNSLESIASNLLNYQGIQARIIKGLILKNDRRNLKLKLYIEVYGSKKWQLFSLEKGRMVKARNFFIWQRGAVPILDSFGTKNAEVTFSIAQRNVSTKSLVLGDPLVSNKAIIDLSLLSLPVSEQNAFRHILLIPIGALVVVFMRIIIGLRTSGTFMPILLALAFMETELVTGLILFISIVGIGLIIRSYLSHLNLLLVARISSVVIVVIGLMSVFSILSYKLGINEALTITFFPMIILAWTIERMSILWEEEGAKEVFVQGSGSLLVAVLAYFAMSSETIAYLSFNFSELLLVILAITILLGRYSGYRLFELIRFRKIEGL